MRPEWVHAILARLPGWQELYDDFCTRTVTIRFLRRRFRHDEDPPSWRNDRDLGIISLEFFSLTADLMHTMHAVCCFTGLTCSKRKNVLHWTKGGYLTQARQQATRWHNMTFARGEAPRRNAAWGAERDPAMSQDVQYQENTWSTRVSEVSSHQDRLVCS